MDFRNFPKRGLARLTRHKPGEMNNSEKAYAGTLEGRILTGEIICYWFEQWTFKLAVDCRLTPDFMLMLPTGELQVHDVKGFMTDDALVKLKVMAEKFPFDVFTAKKLAKKDGGGWEIKQIK